MKNPLFFLNLTGNDFDNFVECIDESKSFKKSVPRFSRCKLGTILFLISNKDQLAAKNSSNFITYLGIGRKIRGADTGKMRISISAGCDIGADKEKICVNIILKDLKENNKKLFRHACNFFNNGGICPPKTTEKIINLLKCSQKFSDMLNKVSPHTRQKLMDGERAIIYQQEAINCAFKLAGLPHDSYELISNKENPRSYLDDIKAKTLPEDQVITRDAEIMPGFKLERNISVHSKFFQGTIRGQTISITITIANKVPLEKQLGADLIYLNENFNSFVFVQYKMMKKENKDYIYRPDVQLEKEIKRMIELKNKFVNSQHGTPNGFRLNYNPFFIKLCKNNNEDYDPSSTELFKGKYIPLELWQVFYNSEITTGHNGGKIFKNQKINRYINQTEFCSFVKNSWVGTMGDNTELCKKIIKKVLEDGKALVVAKSNIK